MPEEQDNEEEAVGVSQCHQEAANAARTGLPAAFIHNSRDRQQQQNEQVGLANNKRQVDDKRRIDDNRQRDRKQQRLD